MNVVVQSDTTELPPALDSQWAAVMALFDVTESEEGAKDALFEGELARWYRRHR